MGSHRRREATWSLGRPKPPFSTKPPPAHGAGAEHAGGRQKPSPRQPQFWPGDARGVLCPGAPAGPPKLVPPSLCPAGPRRKAALAETLGRGCESRPKASPRGRGAVPMPHQAAAQRPETRHGPPVARRGRSWGAPRRRTSPGRGQEPRQGSRVTAASGPRAPSLHFRLNQHTWPCV